MGPSELRCHGRQRSDQYNDCDCRQRPNAQKRDGRGTSDRNYAEVGGAELSVSPASKLAPSIHRAHPHPPRLVKRMRGAYRPTLMSPAGMTGKRDGHDRVSRGSGHPVTGVLGQRVVQPCDGAGTAHSWRRLAQAAEDKTASTAAVNDLLAAVLAGWQLTLRPAGGTLPSSSSRTSKQAT